MARTVGAWVGAILFTVGAYGTAGADNSLQSPQQLKATVSLGKILATDSGAQRLPTYLRANVTLNFRCPEDHRVTQTTVSTALEPKQDRNFKGRHRSENGQTYTLRLATADELWKACGGGNNGIFRAKVKAHVYCYEDNIGSTFDDFWDKEYIHDIPVSVYCKKTLIHANVRPVQWLHSCPSGYSIQGTGKMASYSTSSRPQICVKNGVNYTKACPFVYVYDPRSNTYNFHGEVIPNRSSAAKAGTDRLAIAPSAVVDGVLRIRIAEEKDELSHLDRLALEVDGKTVAPRSVPGLQTLGKTDGHYRLMYKGDALELVYDLPQVTPTSKIELVSAGYYEPVER